MRGGLTGDDKQEINSRPRRRLRKREDESHMIAHGKDIKVITGNSNPGLARDICKELGAPLGNSEVGAFSDGENFVSIYETVQIGRASCRERV